MLRSILAPALLVLSVSAYAAADFVSVSQTRRLESSLNIRQNFSVGPWSVSTGSPAERIYGIHESTIAPGSIDLNCSATCGSSFLMGLWRGEIVRSSLVSDFTVNEPSIYRMQATPTGDLFVSRVNLLSLTAGMDVFFNTFAAQGIIPPGTYRLTINFEVRGQTGGSLQPPPLTGAFIVDFDVEPVPVEACCFANGTCQDMHSNMCVDLGGTSAGAGSTCATLDCSAFCAGDADGDGAVGLSDLATLIVHWNQFVPGQAPDNIDLDRSTIIGLGDVAIAIENWGEVCP